MMLHGLKLDRPGLIRIRTKQQRLKPMSKVGHAEHCIETCKDGKDHCHECEKHHLGFHHGHRSNTIAVENKNPARQIGYLS